MIFVFDIQSRAVVFVLAGHASNIRSMFITEDGELLASASADGTVRIWDMKRRACHAVFEISSHLEHPTPVIQVEISYSKTLLLALTATGDVFEWKIPETMVSFAAPWQLSCPKTVNQLTKYFDEFDGFLSTALANYERELYLKCSQSLLRARSIPGYSRHHTATALWGSLYTKLKKDSLNCTWQLTRRPGKNENYSDLSGVYFSDKYGYYCLAVTTNRQVLALKVPDLEVIASLSSLGNIIHSLYVLPCGKIGVVWGEKNGSGSSETTVATVSLYNTENINTVACCEDFVCARFDAHMNNLVLGTDTGEVKIFNLASERVTASFLAHDHPIASLALSPCGKYLATASSDYYSDIGLPARLWKIDSQEYVCEIGTHSEYSMNSLLFSQDSSTLFVDCGNILVWSLSEMAIKKEIHALGYVEWSDVDCNYITIRNGAETVLYNLHSDMPIQTFRSVCRLSPDCRFAVSIEWFKGNSMLASHFCDWSLITKTPL